MKREEPKPDEREIIFRGNMKIITDAMYPLYVHAKVVHAKVFGEVAVDVRKEMLKLREKMRKQDGADCDQLFLSAMFAALLELLTEWESLPDGDDDRSGE